MAAAARDKFDRFTEEARQVLMRAREEAAEAEQAYLGVEHFLVGLTRVQEGAASRVLGYSGVTTDWARSAIEQMRARSAGSVAATGVSTPVLRTLSRAAEEAHRLNQAYVGTGHLLLALIHEDDGTAGTLLRSLHVDPDQLRDRLMVVLSQSPEPTDAP